MRLLNSCRFKKFCSLLTVMLLMLFSVIPASAAELSNFFEQIVHLLSRQSKLRIAI
jgi:lipopolysaccharide export system protein LptA